MMYFVACLTALGAANAGIVPITELRLSGATPATKVESLVTLEPGLVGLGDGDRLFDTQQVDLRHGAIVRAHRSHQDVPVIDEVLAVRFGADGEPSYLRSDWTPLPTLPAPQLSGRQAVAEALSQAFAAAVPVDAAITAATPHLLVVSPKHGFVYLVSVAGWAPWARRTAVVSAMTGEILAVRSPLRSAAESANVYIPRPPPVDDLPAPEAVTLERLTPANPLLTDGDYALGFNCLTDAANIRVKTCPDVLGSTLICNYAGAAIADLLVAFCGEAHNAPSQNATDGFSYPPLDDAADYSGTAIDSDPFAEVHGYYHLDKITRFAEALGHPVASHTPLKILANFTMPSSGLLTCSTAAWTAVPDNERTHTKAVEVVTTCMGLGFGFDPFDNAFYLGDEYESLLGISHGIYMGQGATADYVYDGDIVYHEYFHGVAAQLGALAAGVVLDATGMDDSPGALGEGFSDYFAASFTGDPATGGYVGGRLGLDGDAIRRLDHSLVCPDYWTGEVHDDSQGWAGALWAARLLYPQTETDATTGLTVRVFDRVVYQALATLSAEASQKDAADAVVAEVKTEPALADTEAAQVSSVFTARNVLDCKRLRPLSTEAPIARLFVEGKGEESSIPMVTSTTFSPYAPGPVQLVIDVPQYGGTTDVVANLSAGQPSMGDAPDLLGGTTTTPDWDVRLVWRSDLPVELQYGTANPIAVTATNGATESPFTITGTGAVRTLRATLTLPAGNTRLYLVIANYTIESAMLSGIKLENLTLNAPPPATPDGNDDGGCNCASASGGALAILAAMALFRRRSR